MNGQIVPRTEPVTLKRQVPDHATGLFEALSDPDIFEFLDAEPPAAVAEVRSRIDRLQKGPDDGSEQWLNWCIFVGNTIAGYTQATVYQDNSASIAYVLAPAYWRQSVGFRACQIMITNLNEDHRVSHLRADTENGNRQSQRLLKRLGFEQVRRDGGDLYYEMSLST